MQTADKVQIKVPEKLYIGVQGKAKFNTENPPLAFATPFGEGVKDFSQRRVTVDNWAGYNKPKIEYLFNADGSPETTGPYGSHAYKQVFPEVKEEGFYIDNEFLEGFYFDKAVSRWSTSNKFFRVTDPRGFQLEIDSANLGDILLNSHISKGYMVGKFAWARYQGKAYLVREDHPSLSKEKKPIEKRTNPKVGDVVVFGQDATNKYVYCGKYAVLAFGYKTIYRHRETREIVTAIPYPPNSNYYANTASRVQLEAQYERVTEELYRKESDTYHIYQCVDSTYKPYVGSYTLYKGYGAVTIIEEDREFTLPEFGKDIITYNTHTYTTGLKKAILFEDKKKLQAFDISSLDIYDKFTTEILANYNRYRTSYGSSQSQYAERYNLHPVARRTEIAKGVSHP